MKELLDEIRACTICRDLLPHPPNPIIQASSKSRILIVGQAPGRRVNESGIPWDDPSGNLLREWMGIDKHIFYDDTLIALVPMGFCYPGKGKSGDLPPRPECAEAWHANVMASLKSVELTILIGQYAQQNYLKESAKESLTENVRAFKEYLPKVIPLPHPSPRNRIWLKRNDWFDKELVPHLRSVINMTLSQSKFDQ